jgi:hypothetical protein
VLWDIVKSVCQVITWLWMSMWLPRDYKYTNKYISFILSIALSPSAKWAQKSSIVWGDFIYMTLLKWGTAPTHRINGCCRIVDNDGHNTQNILLQLNILLRFQAIPSLSIQPCVVVKMYWWLFPPSRSFQYTCQIVMVTVSESCKPKRRYVCTAQYITVGYIM